MTKDERVSAPSSSAGLVRYFDVSTSNIQLSPELVVGIIVGFIFVEIAILVLA